MSAEALRDADVSHQVGLARYSASETRKILALLARTEQDVLWQIARLSWDDVVRASAKKERLEKMLAAVRAAQREGYAVVGKTLTADLAELAVYEAEFQASALSSVEGLGSRAPGAAELRAAAFSRPFQGRVLREWISDLEAGARSRVRDAIRMGFVEGESVDQMVRRIRGTAANKFTDGVMNIGRRGAEALVRTAVTHVASAAKEEFFRQNAEMFRGVQWSSVLDSRTTPVCRSRDGKIWPVGEGPRPPAHVRCRSTVIAVLKGQSAPQAETYSDWFSRQDRATQDDILGPTRGRLYREGGLTMDQFVDRSGRELTLDQLRARESAAFGRAGL